MYASSSSRYWHSRVTTLMNLLSWSTSRGMELQLAISLLKLRPVPEIFLPLRSRSYWEHSARNMAISAIAGSTSEGP